MLGKAGFATASFCQLMPSIPDATFAAIFLGSEA
jgi:hypothetical protein